MDLDLLSDRPAATEVGSYFVANYPPFSVWTSEHVPSYVRTLDAPADDPRRTPLGLYIHIPFCRKRCKFCYFRVYTDKNSSDVDTYLTALAREAALYADRAALRERNFDFVYFGGGTPSFLSSDQLQRLIDRISEHWLWENAREVTFECEPGTLKKGKLETIKAIGTTRLSLGIEHFDDDVLELGGRAHRSPEVFQAYEWAREVGFPQINIDLIAGMVGDTEDKWKLTVEKALALEADSVTIYQMEVPHNTEIARDAKRYGSTTPVPSWATKRWWVDYAFRTLEKAGYAVSSAYTLAKPLPPLNSSIAGGEVKGFVYRDALWHGADLIGTGVASFGHLGGVHYQNVDTWEGYVEALERGQLPLSRALRITDRQRLIREMILQLKLGRLDAAYFREKFNEEITDVFAEGFGSLRDEGLLAVFGDDIRLSRAGLLCVDALLPRFFEKEFHNVRYT
jgi:oxygen-independent coproporphyrinogen-3 oxidase